MIIQPTNTYTYMTPGMLATWIRVLEFIINQNHYTIAPLGAQGPFGGGSPGPGGGGGAGGAGGAGGGGAGGGSGGGSGSGGGALGGQNPPYTPPNPPGGGGGGSGSGAPGVNTMNADDLNHERGHPAPAGPDPHLNGTPDCGCF